MLTNFRVHNALNNEVTNTKLKVAFNIVPCWVFFRLWIALFAKNCALNHSKPFWLLGCHSLNCYQPVSFFLQYIFSVLYGKSVFHLSCACIASRNSKGLKEVVESAKASLAPVTDVCLGGVLC